MLIWFLDFAFVLIALLAIAVVFRLVRGPTLPDRLMAGELAGVLLTFLLALAGAREGSELYLDAALVVALLAFISTVAIARFVLERDSA